MRHIFKFPDIGEGITEGKILEWYVKKGQRIGSGESVVKMETDKVVTDIPSPKEGIIAGIFGQVGDVINVGDPLVEIEVEGEEVVEAKEEPKVAEKSFGVVGTIEVAGEAAHLPASNEGLPEKKEPEKKITGKVLATPVARAMAKDLGVDINKVHGTGPGGRIKKKDIQHYSDNLHKGKSETVEEKPEISRVEFQDLSQIRKAIAKKMTLSKQTAAHMTVIEEVEISELVRLRESHKEEFKEKGVKLTYMPFILKAVAKALKFHPKLNAEMDLENSRMIYKKYYNIGIAVDTKEGLVVPVIQDVDQLSIFDLSVSISEISEKARERKLTLDDLKDGTFSVTNYGSIGGTFGVPVINYPQVGILGVGRMMKKPVVFDEDIGIGNVLPLSMSVDHRIVDGGDASRFIMDVMKFLKDPFSLLLY